MNFAEFKSAVLSVIQENDPYKESKELQLRNWCYSFFDLFTNLDPSPLSFVLDVLSEKGCWEDVDTIHRVELNRKKIARRIVQQHSWTGRTNTLHITERFQIASWCCLGEDIVILFNHYKQQYEIKNYDKAGLKWLAKKLSRDTFSDPLTKFWLYVMGGCASELSLEGKHLYEYGLYLELNGRPNVGHFIGYVEGVKFFWNKIASLSDDQLNVRQKHDIFMRAAVHAARCECGNNPEIFEFCFSQINFEQCLEFLVSAAAENIYKNIFHSLKYMRRFDHLQKIFDCLEPNVITEVNYYNWLLNIIERHYSDNYAKEVMNLFMHIWRKVQFDKHRAFVLENEMKASDLQGILLSLLVTRNYMESVWAILDDASPDQLEEFMESKHTEYIYNVLKNRRDHISLIRFFVPNK